MYIGICGYGYTGSGAVLDLLKEFDGLKVLDDDEFMFPYLPDGLVDLEKHLMSAPSKFFDSDAAIKRFISLSKTLSKFKRSFYYKITNGKFYKYSLDYVDAISQITWKGKWVYDSIYCRNELIKTIKFRIAPRIVKKNNLNCRTMHFSIQPENFYVESKKFIDNVFSAFANFDKIVLNQPFPANNPDISMRFFGQDTKCIVVDKDPRDLYILAKKYINVKWIPTNNVDDFILFYKMQRLNRSNNKNVLYIRFEDLILNFSSTCKQIIEFCGMKDNQHLFKNRFFDPNKSIANTNLFRDNTEFLEDIRKIEKELGEFLYDFSPYSDFYNRIERVVF